MTLALGIGATPAIFSVVNGVLINPLPYPDSDLLVRIVPSIGGIDQPYFNDAIGGLAATAPFWSECSPSMRVLTRS